MEITGSLLPVIGSITAALIAGLVSFAVIVMSKEQKTSEFRQAWIDAVRDDLSELVARLHAMSEFMSHAGTGAVDYARSRHDDFISMNQCIERLRLRLNPLEHQEILHALGCSDNGITKTTDEYHKICSEIIRLGQIILKTEWERVKEGEAPFVELKARILRWSKIFLAVVLSLVFLKLDGLSLVMDVGSGVSHWVVKVLKS